MYVGSSLFLDLFWDLPPTLLSREEGDNGEHCWGIMYHKTHALLGRWQDCKGTFTDRGNGNFRKQVEKSGDNNYSIV